VNESEKKLQPKELNRVPLLFNTVVQPVNIAAPKSGCISISGSFFGSFLDKQKRTNNNKRTLNKQDHIKSKIHN